MTHAPETGARNQIYTGLFQIYTSMLQSKISKQGKAKITTVKLYLFSVIAIKQLITGLSNVF